MTSSVRKQENYGRGEHVIDDGAGHTVDASALKQTLVSVFGDKNYKAPLLPAAAHEVMELSRRSNVSFDDVQRIVEKDSTLAGKVLQVAQSPLYATRVKARTLRDAVQRLGLNAIRDIVWQVALEMRVFRAPGYDGVMAAVQRHSVATAHAARIVCSFSSVSADYAFLCGLLHDLGLPALLIALTEKKDAPKPDIEDMWGALHEVHEEAGAYLVKAWGLDPDLVSVIGNHHHFDADSFPHPLIAVLNVAEKLVADLGFGVLPEPIESVQFDWSTEQKHATCIEQLSLTEAHLAEIQEKLKPCLEQVK